ncbi:MULTISPECIES: hypothetical protein [Pseudoxanthomonas]|uniref:Uncharacterized protein n=1 Tax=Pseudoxanthomonas winnipegensis TaxID=2480810 RepID=A0AAW8GDJ8_9GAMM|nr:MULTISPECIES: hypothetical protein [Pseudoxanthomonas]MDQ1119119.1 hypothetical protein [Pseudoxanthomonas winnipegensis]MDQ1132309.1 hypothetical protein [Pseudoxanthomonas winnipegensis]MDR6137679.1 hypothetical protein [Pseudoxanthomonas sp. SORGH_AS_0997]
MKSETKGRLDGIFAAHQDAQDKKQKAQQVRLDAEAEFLSEFLAVVDSVIKPAFEEIGKYAESQGLKYLVDTQQDMVSYDGKSQSASVSLRFPMDDGRSYRAFNEGPHLSVICNKSKKCAWLHQNTISPMRGGSAGSIGDFQLEQITPEFIHDKVADLLQQVLA